MPLSHEHVESKIPAKIQIYILTKAEFENYLSLFAMRYPVGNHLCRIDCWANLIFSTTFLGKGNVRQISIKSYYLMGRILRK